MAGRATMSLAVAGDGAPFVERQSGSLSSYLPDTTPAGLPTPAQNAIPPHVPVDVRAGSHGFLLRKIPFDSIS